MNILVSMYLRTYTRKNKNGSIVKYYQLAYNVRHPDTKKPTPRIIYNFGRADELDPNVLKCLCKSIARVCDFTIVEPLYQPDPKQVCEKGAIGSQNMMGILTPDHSRQLESTDPLRHKPSCEEIERRLRSSMKQVSRLEKINQRLRENEATLKAIFDNANDEIVHLSIDGKIVDVNDKVTDIFGYTREEVIGKHLSDLNVLGAKNRTRYLPYFGMPKEFDRPERVELEVFRKDNTPIVIEVTSSSIIKDGEITGFICIIRDNTERKNAENLMKQHKDHLSELVKERTGSLEEANAALKVLLGRREEDKKNLEEKILFNVMELILPNIEKVEQDMKDSRKKLYLDVIKSNLKDIVSPFSHQMSSRYYNLTPAELQVANFIKHGKTTKEIAGSLCLSVHSIKFHRKNIRKKLGLNRQKSNLRSFLQFLREE